MAAAGGLILAVVGGEVRAGAELPVPEDVRLNEMPLREKLRLQGLGRAAELSSLLEVMAD